MKYKKDEIDAYNNDEDGISDVQEDDEAKLADDSGNGESND